MKDPYRTPVWLLLPGTRTYPVERVHRVDPLAADVTMCGRRIAAGEVVPGAKGLLQCARCNQRVGRRRAATRAYNESVQKAMNRPHPTQVSVRAVSGGLPGLGKR